MIVYEFKFKEGKYLDILSPDKKASVWTAYSFNPPISEMGLTKEEAIENYVKKLHDKQNISMDSQ